MTALREWTVGKHRLYLEEPDLLIVKMGGHTDLDAAKGLVEIYRELGTRKPFFGILDVTHSPADAEARGYFTREFKHEWTRGIVYVGAGVVERAVGKAMAVAFYFTGKWKAEFLWTNTMDEARALIQQMRAKQSAG